MIKNRQGFSMVFVFFLITLVVGFGVVVLNKQIFFEKKIESSKIQDVVLKNIITLGNLSINYNMENNKNNGIYRPFLSCPNQVSFFSGATLVATGKTIYQDQSCSGSISGKNLQLYYDSTFMSFRNGMLGSDGFTLTGVSTLTGILTSTASIAFIKPTAIDTTFINGRLEVNGILFKNTGFNNVFWNNKDVRRVINENTNNTGSFSKMGDVTDGSVYIDINGAFSGKIIEFNRDFYNNESKLIKLNEFVFSSPTGSIGYIQGNGSVASNISDSKKFDFKNKDYALFLSYETGSFDNIRYKIKVLDNTVGKFAYLTPIKDDTQEIQYLGSNIVINTGNYFYKVYKLTDYKNNILNALYGNCSVGGTIPCLTY